jgi:predicted hydrolase (HD superfamily)
VTPSLRQRDRDEVAAGVSMLEVDLGDHIEFIIDALKSHAEELGLGGA